MTPHSPVVVLKSEQEFVSLEHADLVTLPIRWSIARYKVWLFPAFMCIRRVLLLLISIAVLKNAVIGGRRRYIHHLLRYMEQYLAGLLSSLQPTNRNKE